MNLLRAAMPRYEAYKDSGVEWLGEIPACWGSERLKYLLNEVNLRSERGEEELLALSKYKGIVKRSSLEERAGQANTLIGYKKVSNGQLVVNKMQAVNGLLAVSNIDGITSPDYSIYEAKSNHKLNIYYLNYLLIQPELLVEFKKKVKGVMEGFIRLYTDDLYDIKVILPPINEQNAIASFLDRKTAKIDQAIAIKEKQIALLKERKQILIQNAVTRGLDPDAPMRDSGVEWIGEIPAHWDVRRIKFLARIRNGQIDPKESKQSQKTLIAPNHIESRTGKILYKESAAEQGAESGKYKANKGDILYCKIRPELRKVCIADENCLCSADMYPIKLKSSMKAEFLFYVFLLDHQVFFYVKQDLYSLLPFLGQLSDFTRI